MVPRVDKKLAQASFLYIEGCMTLREFIYWYCTEYQVNLTDTYPPSVIRYRRKRPAYEHPFINKAIVTAVAEEKSPEWLGIELASYLLSMGVDVVGVTARPCSSFHSYENAPKVMQ